MKRTLQIISCIGFILFSINTYSQTDLTTPDDFLKDYRPPNFTFKSWIFWPDFRESSSKSDNFNRSQVNLRLRNNFLLMQQKDRSTSELRIGLENEIRSGKVDTIKNGNDNYFDTDLNVTGSRDFYLKEKIFLGAGTDTRYGFRRQIIDDWTANVGTDVSINLGIGFGRVFSVMNAWRATSLFNDLECNGIAVDRSYLRELSDLLTMQNNRRILDGRLARIQNQQELFSFLQENNIAEFTPFSVPIINDSYRFETFRPRLSGFRLYAGVRPGLVFNNTKTEQTETKEEHYYLLPFANLNYHLPINEDWQLDVLTSFNYKNLLNDDVYFDIRPFANVSVSWMPNLRIRSTASITYNGAYRDLRSFTSINLGYQLNYYFSPRMLLDFSAIVGKRWQDANGIQINPIEQRVTFGINYFIF